MGAVIGKEFCAATVMLAPAKDHKTSQKPTLSDLLQSARQSSSGSRLVVLKLGVG